MHKLNLVKYYRVGIELNRIKEVATGEPPAETLMKLSGPLGWLSTFLSETNPIPMVKTRNAAMLLEEAVRHVYLQCFESMRASEGKTLSYEDNMRVRSALENFEVEFEHDSREINIFSVPNRCAYSTTILIDNGESLLPELVRGAISDYALNEIREAGRCLAFGLATAAGFHLLRGLEAVLRAYYDAISNGAPRPKTKWGSDLTMAGYIDEVEARGADVKVVSVLRQIKDLHRNPHMHPQVVLTDEETQVLVGVVVSAITGMADDAQQKGHASISTPP